MSDLVVWHVSARVSHARAAETAAAVLGRRPAGLAIEPAVAAFAAELRQNLPDLAVRGDGRTHVLIALGAVPAAKAVPLVRYLAAKHRLACFDTRQQAVVNPPLLRRIDAAELTSAGDLPIEDPSAAHIERAVRELDDDFWFLIIDHDDDHYVQAAIGAQAGARPDGFKLEIRDGDEHLQADVGVADDVIRALQDHVAGDDSWRQRFTWQPVGR